MDGETRTRNPVRAGTARPVPLAAWLNEAGEEGITWEAKADDEKGRLHIDSVRKAACGLANQIGGYIVIGAKWDKNARSWSLRDVTPPDPEPEMWIGKAMRGLQPVPRYALQSWLLDDGRLVAVIWVEPVDVPPCMTSQGRIYERVSGETLPVQDPVLLDRLQRRGDKTDDIGARRFVPSFREAIVAATWSFWGNGQPQGIDPRQEQDAFTVGGHFDEGYNLMSGGAATRRHRSSWLLQATWDGTIATAAHFSPDALIGNATVETVVQRGWREAVPLVERLGGYGPAHLSLVYAVMQPTPTPPESSESLPETRAVPPRGGIFERLPESTWIRRRTTVREPSSDDLGSVQRELQRAAGIESYEAEAVPSPRPRLSMGRAAAVDAEVRAASADVPNGQYPEVRTAAAPDLLCDETGSPTRVGSHACRSSFASVLRRVSSRPLAGRSSGAAWTGRRARCQGRSKTHPFAPVENSPPVLIYLGTPGRRQPARARAGRA